MWPSQKHLRIKINFFHLVFFLFKPILWWKLLNYLIKRFSRKLRKSILKKKSWKLFCTKFFNSLVISNLHMISKQGQINSYSYRVSKIKLWNLQKCVYKFLKHSTASPNFGFNNIRSKINNFSAKAMAYYFWDFYESPCK